MSELTHLILKNAENINKIISINEKEDSLQNLSNFIVLHQDKLKTELSYPLFWSNFNKLIALCSLEFKNHEVTFNKEKKTILLKNINTKIENEIELSTPQELISLISQEKFMAEHRFVLELMCSNADVFISLNFAINIPD